MLESQTHTIYALTYDNEVLYIGQAKDVQKRYKQHCSLAQNRGNTKKNIWLTELLENGLKPELKIIEETDCPDEREVHWIKHYRSINKNLLNTADGGKTMDYLKRAKQSNPWGRGYSPVQRRLMSIKDTINMFKRTNDPRAEHLQRRLVEVNKVIKKVGLKKANEILWSRHDGKTNEV